MKQFAIIYNTGTQHYEVHKYNWLFKLLPLGNSLTYYFEEQSLIDAKEKIERMYRRKFKIIEIFTVK